MKKLPIIEIALIVLGSILYFSANFQRVAVPGAIFDMLQNDLHTTTQCVTNLGSSLMYTYAISQLVIGVLIARYGGFRIVTFGSILFFIGSLLFPFAQSLPLLYFSRVLIGLGSGTFYLGMINETRKVVSKKNFGICLSIMLLVGYIGSIIANAPLVLFIKNLKWQVSALGPETTAWREAFLIVALITVLISLIFIVLKGILPKQPIDRTVHFDLELFKSTFKNTKNYSLYAFSCLNYGLYYVVQTVWGKKFLEDFFSIPEVNAAIFLSLMGGLYAIGGPIMALASRNCLERKTIFLKLSSLNSLIVFTSILLITIFEIHTTTIGYIVGYFFCTISFCASLSPLLISLLHDYNGSRVANTSVSIMTAGFYTVVALLANISGFFLDKFTPIGMTKHSTDSYIAIFVLMTILAIISFINSFKIEESERTKRFILHQNYIKEQKNSAK
ncbi:MFS transporter [bacterium]|nr:MFS transporter [bacterium]